MGDGSQERGRNINKKVEIKQLLCLKKKKNKTE